VDAETENGEVMNILVPQGDAEVQTLALVLALLLGFADAQSLQEVKDAARRVGIVPDTGINNVDSLSTLLSVTFNQPPESYSYCGNTYSPPAVSYALNSSDYNYRTPWDARSWRSLNPVTPANGFQYTPTVTWVSKPDFYYTLIMIDPIFIHGPNGFGPWVQHYMVCNITGNSNSALSGGNVVNPFLGPGNQAPVYNKYTFLLFEQESPLYLSAGEQTAIQGRAGFNLTTFMLNHNMSWTNLVGINWIFAQVDTFSPYFLGVLGFVPPPVCPTPAPTPTSSGTQLNPQGFLLCSVVFVSFFGIFRLF